MLNFSFVYWSKVSCFQKTSEFNTVQVVEATHLKFIVNVDHSPRFRDENKNHIWNWNHLQGGPPYQLQMELRGPYK